MNKLSPLKSIRLKCLECSNDSTSEVRNCVITDCPLYEFRLGKNPNRKGVGNHTRHTRFAEKSRREMRAEGQRIDSNSSEGVAK
ncbi:MAG: hypothetical protein WAO19_08550 [Candidatus Kryptoniota bacterium]